MPRRRARTRATREPPSEALLSYLTTGENKGEGKLDIYVLGERGPRKVWGQLRDEIMAEWIRERPGHRPHGWWKFDAPGKRQKVGGSGILYDHAWADFFLPGEGCRYEDPDPQDPPRFESEAAFLKRHGLLSAEERRRLSPGAFEPEVLVVDWGELMAGGPSGPEAA